jgi:hypothetical protein
MFVSNESDLFATVRANRKPSRKSAAKGEFLVDDSDAYPCLVDLLGSLPSGASPKAKPGRVGFYCYNGRLSVACNIPSMLTCGFMTLEGFTDAFARVEKALREGKMDWREDS